MDIIDVQVPFPSWYQLQPLELEVFLVAVWVLEFLEFPLLSGWNVTERGQIHSITTDLLPKMAPCLLTWMKLDYPAYIWKRWHFYPEKQVHSLFFCWVCLIARTHKYKKIENKCLKKYMNQHFEELRSYKPTVKTGVNAFCCFEFDLWPSNSRFFFFFFILSSHSTNCNKDVWTKHQQGNVRIHILSLHISQNHDTDKPTVCAAARCATCSRGSK